jgi:hypothetical protein
VKTKNTAPSYGSKLIIAAVLIVLMQPWIMIGSLLYHDWAHFGPSLNKLLVALVWVAFFFGSLWWIFANLRHALRVAGSLRRKMPVILIVLAGIMMAGVVCYPLVVLPAGARWVPAEEPAEDRRVVHPLGFSIVSPPGWKSKIWNMDKEWGGITLLPGYKGRHGPGLGVSTDMSAPDLTQFRETPFLDSTAWERSVTGKGENARLRYELIVTHKGRWYQVTYSESRSFERNPSLEFPDIMKRYVRSFRPPP